MLGFSLLFIILRLKLSLRLGLLSKLLLPLFVLSFGAGAFDALSHGEIVGFTGLLPTSLHFALAASLEVLKVWSDFIFVGFFLSEFAAFEIFFDSASDGGARENDDDHCCGDDVLPTVG